MRLPDWNWDSTDIEFADDCIKVKQEGFCRKFLIR